MQSCFILSNYCIIVLLVAVKPLILRCLHGTFLRGSVSKQIYHRVIVCVCVCVNAQIHIHINMFLYVFYLIRTGSGC